MAYASDNSFLLSDQDANQFLVQAEIESQISNSTMKARKCVKTKELFRLQIKNYGLIDFTLT